MLNKAIISAQGLCIGYPKNRQQSQSILYEDISFSLYAGELTCLLGINGSGKSTLLRTLSRLQAPLSGKISLMEKDLQSYNELQLSMLLGLVLTDKISAGGLTVKELVSLGRYPYTGFWGRLTDRDEEIVYKSMLDVSILDKQNSYIAELSDGERQKVMIAKSLAQECPIIILDEPTAFLDVVNRIEIMNLLHELAVSQNKTILLSTHDIELALMMADRIWLLAKHNGLMCGTTEDIIFSNAISKYIGNKEIAFDRHSGRFSSIMERNKVIYLKAEGDLFIWAKNFLWRHAYTIVDEGKAELSLHAVSPQQLIINKAKSSRTFSSFESLARFLKSEIN